MLHQSFNRRRLLHAGIVGGIGLWATACSPPTSETVQQSSTKAPLAAKPAASTAATSRRSCGQYYQRRHAIFEWADRSATRHGQLRDHRPEIFTLALRHDQRLPTQWAGVARHGCHEREAGPGPVARQHLRGRFPKVDRHHPESQPEIGGDPENDDVTIFGTPGDPTWSWRFEGHHLSRRFTIAGDKITITPFFHGVWPTVSEAGRVIMQRVEWAAREIGARDWMPRCAARWSSRNSRSRCHVTWNEDYVQPLDPVGAPLVAL